mgnify:CR=1 FL=1
MNLSSKDIHHIAGLAKLKLTDKEVVQYRREISGIVRYVAHLAETNIAKADVALRISEYDNSLRHDSAAPWEKEEQEMALTNAPRRKGRFISAPRVFQ